MILILSPDTNTDSEEFRQLELYLDQIPNVRHRIHQEIGEQQLLTEVYLIGDTASLSMEDISSTASATSRGSTRSSMILRSA